MPLTQISDLWVPEIWVPGVMEKANKLPLLLNSPAVVKNAQFDQFASGAGQSVNIPNFKDMTETDDEVQAEDTAPTTNKLTSGKQVAPMLNRVSAFSVTALSAAASGSDPVGAILQNIALTRLKQRQKALVYIMRGAFHTALTDVDNAIHNEDGASPAAANLIDADAFIDSVTLLGELAETADIGAIWVHPVIRGALLKQDENSFERTSENGGLVLETYKGYPLYTSVALVRDGTTSGKVYESYILTRNCIARGEKPQSTRQDMVDVASMMLDLDVPKNNIGLYDRTRSLVHPAGLQWTGTPAGESPTNAELATGGNWALAFSNPENCGMVRVTSNG